MDPVYISGTRINIIIYSVDVSAVGNKPVIRPKMYYGENSKKHIKNFFLKKIKFEKIFKNVVKKKISVLKKILKTKNFVLKNTKNDLVKREIKIFSKFLKKMKAEIMPDSPVEYLRNGNFHRITGLFPTALTY